MEHGKRLGLVVMMVTVASLVDGSTARAGTVGTTSTREAWGARQAVKEQLVPTVVQSSVAVAQDAPRDATRNVNVALPVGGGVLQIVGVVEGSGGQGMGVTVQSFLTITETNISITQDSVTYIVNGTQQWSGSTTFTKTGTLPPVVVSGTGSLKGEAKITPPAGPTINCPIDLAVEFGNGGGFTWSGTICGQPVQGSGSLRK